MASTHVQHYMCRFVDKREELCTLAVITVDEDVWSHLAHHGKAATFTDSEFAMGIVGNHTVVSHEDTGIFKTLRQDTYCRICRTVTESPARRYVKRSAQLFNSLGNGSLQSDTAYQRRCGNIIFHKIVFQPALTG